MNPKMRAVYANLLQQTIETACHDLIDWRAFAADCDEQEQRPLAEIARQMAGFAESTRVIVNNPRSWSMVDGRVAVDG